MTEYVLTDAGTGAEICRLTDNDLVGARLRASLALFDGRGPARQAEAEIYVYLALFLAAEARGAALPFKVPKKPSLMDVTYLVDEVHVDIVAGEDEPEGDADADENPTATRGASS